MEVKIAVLDYNSVEVVLYTYNAGVGVVVNEEAIEQFLTEQGYHLSEIEYMYSEIIKLKIV